MQKVVTIADIDGAETILAEILPYLEHLQALIATPHQTMEEVRATILDALDLTSKTVTLLKKTEGYISE